ncbi:hypothetical protein KAT63_02140 [Candidatus Parcubacteria bacterium]|nr:hypothetical protein [Candidatus Parcubacteria bacterium]
MMLKKIIASVALVATVAVSAAMFAAYEAHVINVTAHIENALTVHPEELKFGTVFPQEYLERQITIETSSSFQAEEDALAVSYVIKQKPKCEIDTPTDGMPQYAPVHYATHLCPDGYTKMETLCPFLSKMDGDPEDNNDTGHPSYYTSYLGDPSIPGPDDTCRPWGTEMLDAFGVLNKNDLVDLWIIDLKVPPVDGYVGQDWPLTCDGWTVPTDSLDYGCDLWIEVTNISRTAVCGNGIVEGDEECDGCDPIPCNIGEDTGERTCINCTWSECIPFLQ